MNVRFPTAPASLPSGMPALLVELARLWAEDPERPRPDPRVLEHWDRLIAVWATDPSLPLYVRKVDNNRGSLIAHRSGRQLIPSDNSPAQWAYASAVLGEVPSLEQIREHVRDDRIPIAMILKAGEKTSAKYRCTLGKSINPNSAGWKVCHVQGVGLGTRTSVVDVDDGLLREHFRKLMAPSNMFVIPLKYAGLGELPEFCQAIGRLLGPL